MDPYANVAEQRRIAQNIIGQPGRYGLKTLLTAATALAELVLALDEWRRKGGFDPYAGNPVCSNTIIWGDSK